MAVSKTMPKVRTLNDFLVPGMLNLSIENVLVMLREHSYTMQESQVIAQRVFSRLLFLRLEVENKPIGTRIQSDIILRYGELVGNVLLLLRKYSTKTLVARIAANRRFLEGVVDTHKRIDYFFSKVNLSQRPEMTEWSKNWEADLKMQQQLYKQQFSINLVVNAELTERGLEEALTEMKFELTKPQKTIKQKEMLENVLGYYDGYHTSTLFGHKMLLKPVPEWFISRDEIQYKQEPFAIGTYGAVHRGTIERTKAKIVVKCLYSDSKQTQEAIYAEGELWNRLDHPNVLKMKGGNYVGSPMYLLCEDAGDRRSFDLYFGDSDKNKQKLWYLFLEAAEGLAYLHAKGIVHNNLKCSNMLVGVDGRVKLCDFGFSHDMGDSTATSPKKHTTAVRWKGPELLLGGNNVFPSFASDIYSFGMCIIEAVTGGLPWGRATSDQAVIDNAAKEKTYGRPANAFTDKQWNLVNSLCAVDPSARLKLADAIKELKDVIRVNEGRAIESTKACTKCTSANPTKNKFCNECGNRFPENTITP